MGMEGKASESIQNYIIEIHGTLINSLVQMMEEYIAKLLVYEEGYYNIDTNAEAMLTQDVFDNLWLDLESKRDALNEVKKSIAFSLSEIDDICNISSPNETPIF